MLVQNRCVGMNDIRQRVDSILGTVRQPAYTGENRCLPCTVLNTGIAVAIAVSVALFSVPVAIAVFVCCLTVIGLRGYLVPGTPTLVQYLPDRIHNAIGPTHELEESVETSLDVETTLKTAGIITDCPEVDDLCLTDSYREEWRRKMDSLQDERTQRERLARSIGVTPEDITFEEKDTGWLVSVEEIRAGRWQSEAAFIADLASEDLLDDYLEHWETRPANDRTTLLVALRSFIERCPTCGGSVVPDEDVVKSCCREDIVSVTTTCQGCGSVLFKGTE